MTPRRHQFSFHSGRNDNNLVRIPLISNRPCCSPLLCFGVWNALSLKTKVSSLCDLMLSCSLDLLSVTELWLTSNDSITIADLTNSLEDYALHHLPRSTRRGDGLAVIVRKGLHVSRNKAVFFLFSNILIELSPLVQSFSPRDSISASTVQEKWLYSRCRLKCKRQTILWPFFSADMSSSMRTHRDHILELVKEMWKSRLCCEMHPNVGGSCIGALWPWVSYGIVGWRHSIWFGCRYNARLSQWKPSLHCLRVTNSERTQQSIQLQHQICSIEAKCSGWCVITTALPSAFNEEDAIYRAEERLVHLLAIAHKEIRYATRVDPVLSSALEFVKQGWAQHVEDLRLQPFFNRRLKLSVEQDCLLWGHE